VWLALAVALSVGAAACGSDAEPADPARAATERTVEGRQVLVLGDSLTVGARLWGDLGGRLAADGWSHRITAEDGRAVEWGIEQVERLDEVPPVVVVGFGTNPGVTPERFPERVTELVDALPVRGATTVVWWVPPAAGATDRAERAAALQAAALRAAGDPLVVAEWPAELEAHPDWVSADGIHYTDDGYAGLAGFITAQLAPYARP
jgi:lysophospholipase L1-like esterase